MASLIPTYSSIDDALVDIRDGKFVVVVDTSEQQRWGGLTIAADKATPEAVNFIVTHARGPLYLCLSRQRCADLGLATIGRPTPRSGATFMVSLEASHGITSGVSVEDRSRTIRLAADPASSPSDFVYPGHVPVLRARQGGVLERARQIEAAIDLAKLAGLQPASTLSAILKDDGAAASGAEVIDWCERHGIKMISISDVVLHRRSRERLVERMVSVRMPTSHGEFKAVAFQDVLTGEHHVALVKGDVEDAGDVLVRVHTQCLLGDVFHSVACDCAQDLDAALARVEAEGRGVVLYISRPGRGLGWLGQQASAVQGTPIRAQEATDVRDYGIGSQILVELGITRVRLLTDHPRDVSGTELYGLTVVDQVPLWDGKTKTPREHHQDMRLDDAID